MAKSPLVSIVIVNYKSRNELLECIASIKTKSSYEVIIVDNDEVPTPIPPLPHVTSVHNPHNDGYGAGMNLGASIAQGTYLFILNPDTILTPGAIDSLLAYFKKHPEVGIAAPNLSDMNGKLHTFVGTGKLTPIVAIFSLSLIHRLFPTNPIAKRYWLPNKASGTADREVIPGTAFMISKKLFDSIGGFDLHFFLYFEEFDLCKRVRELGYKIVLLQSVIVRHVWGASTKSRSDRDQIFRESRNYYFQKHYGNLWASIVNLF